MIAMDQMEIPHVDVADIVVDGKADEPVWDRAVRIDGFVVNYPTFDTPPAGQTVVRMFADDRALYLFIDAHDPQPRKISAVLGRRDSRWKDDLVAVYLDPSGDGQRAYMFSCNAIGVQMDGIQLAGADWLNLPWDGIWDSNGHVTEDGYKLELAIPWRSIRRSGDSEKLGLFVTRYISRNNEWSSWPRVDPDVQGTLVHEAVLSFPAMKGSFGLQLTPELTFGWTDDGPADTGLSYQGISPGLTLRYSPSISSSLLATVNPDYSQVEADESRIDVNRRYALSYDEKRAFFQEGQEWFEHPLDNVVYTRSMVSPIYGLRGTAELGNWSVAASQVLDANPPESISEGGGWTEAELEGHTALESIVRLRRRVGQDSYAGALLSNRYVLGTEMANTLAGIDGRARLSEKTLLSAALLGSHTSYVDGTADTSPAAVLRGTYASKRLYLDVASQLIGPGFRAENGFIPQADYLLVAPTGVVTFYPRWKALPRLDVQPLGLRFAWNTAGDLREQEVLGSVTASFANGISAYAMYAHRGELYNDAWLPYDRVDAGFSGLWTPWLKTVVDVSSGTGPYYASEPPVIGRQDGASASVTLLPMPAWTLSLSGGWERFRFADGLEAYQGWVGRAKLELFASRRLSLRLIGDQSTFRNSRIGEALLAWEVSPGKLLFVGGSVADDLGTEEVPLSWQVFAKGSWVFAW